MKNQHLEIHLQTASWQPILLGPLCKLLHPVPTGASQSRDTGIQPADSPDRPLNVLLTFVSVKVQRCTKFRCKNVNHQKVSDGQVHILELELLLDFPWSSSHKPINAPVDQFYSE